MAIRTYGRAGKVTDAGLAAYMQQVFNYMAGGVALSGLVAYLTLQSPALLSLSVSLHLPLALVWMFSGFFLPPLMSRLQPAGALGIFAGYSAYTGFLFTPLALMYAQSEIFTAFVTAAVMFGGASAYGYLTRRSLAGWSGFIGMGMIGLFGFLLVMLGASFFFGYDISGMSLVFSLLVIPLFAAATAMQTNELRDLYAAMGGDDVAQSRTAIYGAYSLYTYFVVMFIHILNLLGIMRSE